MLFNSPEVAKAEIEYRRAAITESYRRANRRRSARPEAAPEHSSGRRLAKVRPAA